MITPKDIKNLTDYQIVIFREIFVTKEEFKEHISEHIIPLKNAIDAVFKELQLLQQNSIIINHRLENLEKITSADY